MAIKDQCNQCVSYRQGICGVSSVPPIYDQTSCESYKKIGIDLSKHNNTNVTNKTPQTTSSNKQRMFSAPFSFHGRIRRLEYGLSYIITYIWAIIVEVLVGAANVNEGVIYLLLLLLIPEYWFLYAQGAKRCHDRDNSGWYQIIPFYMLWMLFADGDAHDNSYGPDPKGRK